ncbi:methyltransferase domain-containing protein [Candidatus Peribacteria bacterium]|nr:methyltransferase domain-containing protein [Candidatus Peribacteria bacterium]
MSSWTFADMAAHWDSVAYDKSNAKIDSYLRRFIDSAPLFTIPPQAQVLDIDCRTANGTIFFQNKYPTATLSCIAMAESFVRIAREKIGMHGMQASVTQLQSLPLSAASEQFDTVLCYETVEHVPDPQVFIAELARVLKPNGTLVLTTPNRLWEPIHWLSATFKLDHGEGPHRMLPRKELIGYLTNNGLHIQIERTFVLIPAGPKWLLRFGKWLENTLPQPVLQVIALRRTFICHKSS